MPGYLIHSVSQLQKMPLISMSKSEILFYAPDWACFATSFVIIGIWSYKVNLKKKAVK